MQPRGKCLESGSCRFEEHPDLPGTLAQATYETKRLVSSKSATSKETHRSDRNIQAVPYAHLGRRCLWHSKAPASCARTCLHSRPHEIGSEAEDKVCICKLYRHRRRLQVLTAILLTRGAVPDLLENIRQMAALIVTSPGMAAGMACGAIGAALSIVCTLCGVCDCISEGAQAPEAIGLPLTEHVKECSEQSLATSPTAWRRPAHHHEHRLMLAVATREELVLGLKRIALRDGGRA